jgi:membrane protein
MNAHRQTSLAPVHPWMARLHGLADVLWDAVGNFMRNGDANQAAAIALYAFLSIIPLFILSVMVAGRVLGAQFEAQTRLTLALESFHPGFSGQLLSQLGRIDEKLRVLGWIGVGTLIWLSSLIFGAMETALNISFRARTQRNYIQSKLLAIAMIPLGWGVALTSVLFTTLAALLHQGALMRYVLPWIASTLFVIAVYRIIPTTRPSLRILATGSLLFAALLEPAKHLFAWYIAHHTGYHEIFGSLETVVVLVIWVFYAALLFLFCAELMSSYQRRDLLLLEHSLLDGSEQQRADSPRTGRLPYASRNQRLYHKFGRLFPAGATIFSEGSEDREMYFVIAGTIRLERRSGQTRKLLAEMGPGQYFGEMATLMGLARTATAIATTDCELVIINAALFQHLLRESERIGLHMLREFSRRMRETDIAMDTLSRNWTEAAILLHLLRPSSPCHSAEELAQATGCALEDALEVLRSFASESIIQMDHKGICLMDPDSAWGRLMNLFGPESRTTHASANSTALATSAEA